jgi:hypothetical protein
MKLNLDDVTSMLGVSTDSVLNHIKKKRLSADTMKHNGEKMYVFDFGQVKDFASEFLDIDLTEPNGVVKMTGMFFDEEYTEEISPETLKKKKKTKVASKKNDESQMIADILKELKSENKHLFKQLSDYKEQAAFQIGQLKSQIESSQKMLTSGQKEMEEKQLMISKLKRKLKSMHQELETEKTAIDKMSLVERIFKIKRMK